VYLYVGSSGLIKLFYLCKFVILKKINTFQFYKGYIMINKMISVATISFLLAMSSTTYAGQLTGCAAKKNELETQITYAKKHDNTYRIQGLEKALKEINENCTDESLKTKRMKKITEKEQKVAERKHDLKEAKETGNPDKIKKKERKLETAVNELSEAKNELSR